MDYEFTMATWLWLLIPMPVLVVLSFISYMAAKGKGDY